MSWRAGCADMQCHVNLIPLNEREGAQSGSAVTEQEVAAFQKRLELKNISATVRREMGADIDGACGQLRRKALHNGVQRLNSHHPIPTAMEGINA